MHATLERTNGHARLRFTRHLKHPPEAVWEALTAAEELTAWFPAAIDGDWRPGAPLRFTFHDPAEAAEHLGVEEAPVLGGEVIAYEPYTHLEYRWDTDTLRFDLQPEEDGTRLTLTVTFDGIGRAAQDAAGWHECLDLLVAHLSGQAPDFDKGQRWAELHPTYVERFGPDAATNGPAHL